MQYNLRLGLPTKINGQLIDINVFLYTNIGMRPIFMQDHTWRISMLHHRDRLVNLQIIIFFTK